MKINLQQFELNPCYFNNAELFIFELTQIKNRKTKNIRLKAIEIIIEKLEKYQDDFKEMQEKYNPLVLLLLPLGLTIWVVYILGIDRDFLQINLVNGTITGSDLILLSNQLLIIYIMYFTPSKTKITYSVSQIDEVHQSYLGQ